MIKSRIPERNPIKKGDSEHDDEKEKFNSTIDTLPTESSEKNKNSSIHDILNKKKRDLTNRPESYCRMEVQG